MKKFRFIDISFNHIPEKIYIAIEELHFQNTFALNGFYLFKNSKDEEFEHVTGYKRSTVDLDIKELEIYKQLDVIKYTAIAKFQEKYGANFDKKVNLAQFNSYDDIKMFKPYGFKDSIYDDICETIISEELRERFQEMKGL